MPNTIASDLKNDLILDKAIEAFTAALTPLMVFGTDMSPMPGEKGQSVTIGNLAAASAAAAFAGTYTRQDSTKNAIKVSLDQHNFVSWYLTDVEVSQSSTLRLENFGRQKGFQLAKKVFQDVLSVITASNYGTAVFTGADSTFDKDDVKAIGKAADSADWPEGGRSLVIGSDYYWELLGDANISQAQDFGGSEAIRQGVIPGLFGFDIYKSTLIPGNSENLVGFSCLPDALGFALRYLMPQDEGVLIDARPVTDPNGSGATIGYREWYDPDKGERVAVLEAVYGYAKANGTALDRMVSA